MDQTKSCETREKYGRIMLLIMRFLIWVMLTRLCVFSAIHGDQLVFHYSSFLQITFFMIPYLLLGALYGYVLAYLSFLISFTCTIIFSMNTAYNMVVYLAAITCFALFSQYFWFRTKKRTAFVALITLLLTSFLEFVCLTILQTENYSFEMFGNYGKYLLGDFAEIFMIAFFLHLFLTKAPDAFKFVFPLGNGYTENFRENTEFQRRIRKTRISVKITAIIIGVEFLLGVSVSCFMITLFPDLKDVMISNYRRNEGAKPQMEETVSETEDTSDVFIHRMENLDFAFGVSAFAYDVKMILLMLCVGVPLGGFANFYTKVAIGGPLGDLSDFMEEFAAADDDKKTEVGKKIDELKARPRDEIGTLLDTSTTMVHSVEEYIERIREEQKLQTELEVAKKASEAKGSFLSNMSHEIRTPINAVLGMNEMILREASDPQIEEYAQNIKSAGNSLLGIVNDILDFSKIEAGKMEILLVEYHLSSTINDLINMISVKAEDKGLKLDVQVNPEIPDKLIGDEIRIKQCVTNILTNAVKYTETGSVTLYVDYRKTGAVGENDGENEKDDIFLQFRVVDTGIGIKEEDLEKLFSPFERIEEIRNRTIEGTGLGMSIVKKLLAMMDTRLEVKSVYGEGSDFSFEVRQQVAGGDAIGNFQEKYKAYLASLEKYHESFRAPEASILVVDDTAMNLTVVKGLLKKTLVQVDTAESGKETLEMALKKKYDVLFIDHRMPEMDGLETLAALKELEGNLSADAPCIALTANAGAGAREEYLSAGFDDYLAKPVSGPELEKMLRTYLPHEKVQEATEPEEDGAADGGSTGSSGFAERMKGLPGIDAAEALKNCGGAEILENVVKDFRISIDKKADDIERFANEADYRNYTVAVHALKSSARLIGAMKLSGDAAYLEQCGNEEAEDEIREKTPELLKTYRGLKEILDPLCKEENRDDLPEIPEQEFYGALGDMKELLEAYDFDTADNIMTMLSEYKIPENCREKYEKIKELMAAVDRDALLTLLQ